MMISCPHCQASINLKMPKPGKYSPKCPNCGQPFLLIVPDDPGMTIQVRKLPAPSSSGKLNPNVKSQAGPSSAISPESTTAFQPAAEASFDSNASTETTIDQIPGRAVSSARRSEATSTEVTGDFSPSNRSFASVGSATEATGDFTPSVQKPGEETTDLGTAASAASRLSTSSSEATTDFAPPSAQPRKGKNRASDDPEIPEQLGGYAVLKQLGKGGMGAVYLARQLSLDRPVALKVMNPAWADDPVFLARFIREAYAAAQLNHHNVVQIYDIGADAGINFFSMEFVEGKSLGDVLRKNGRLEPRIAVGYILQAARGLKFAHDRGMVHRDVKPDNLMLNSEGIVKVADLGLVKTREMTAGDDAAPNRTAAATGDSEIRAVARTDVTIAGTAMGSPSYMAPEQCRDAAAVDHRADIYSLGCSLYALLAGRAPFQGDTAMEVISKHLTEPPPPLDSVVSGLPAGLSKIVDRALAKDPEDRYPTMDEFIRELKAWQDQQSAGPPRPSEEQISMLEQLTERLTSAALPKLAATLAVVMPLAGLLAALIMMFVQPVVAVAVLVAVAASVLVGFVASGMLTGSTLFRKVRSWVFMARIIDWLTVAVAGLLLLAGLYMAGLLLAAVIAAAVGAVLGLGFAYGLARTIANQRADIKSDIDSLLKRMRLAGMEEDQIRDFVVQAAGDDWEQVYELLFGYEAKLAMRANLAKKGEQRPKYAAWRDPIIQRIDRLREQRDQEEAKLRLQKLEVQRLIAEGLSPAEARARAADAAEDLIEQAAEIRAANLDQTRRVNVAKMLTRYERAKLAAIERPRPSPTQKFFRKLTAIPLDPRLRLLLGALLIVGGILWIRQNDAIFRGSQTLGAVSSGSSAGLMTLVSRLWEPGKQVKPLQVAFLPTEISTLFDSVNPILAGGLLILGAFSGHLIGILFTVLGATLMMLGHKLGWPIPTAAGLTAAQTTAIVGMILGAIGLYLGRRS